MQLFLSKSSSFKFNTTLGTILLFFNAIFSSYGQCPTTSPIVINTVTTTESRCQSSGSATINASGTATPFMYAIIAGPSLRPLQNNNFFDALTPGTYTVRATDACNNINDFSFSIAGNYTLMNPTATTTKPSCVGGSDGSITIAANGSRPPFQYQILSPVAYATSLQSSNIFVGLPAGTYQYRVYDSCNNFQTRTVSITDNANNAFSLYPNSCIYRMDCSDSFRRIVSIYYDLSSGGHKFPYTLTYQSGLNTITKTISAGNTYTIEDTIYLRKSQWSSYSVTVTNGCGYTQNLSLGWPSFGMNFFTSTSAGCTPQNSYSLFGVTDPFCTGLSAQGSDIYYNFYNSNYSTLLERDTNNFYVTGYATGTYKLVRDFGCGTDTATLNWVNPSNYLDMSLWGIQPGPNCRLGTARAIIFINRLNPYVLTLESGPATYTSPTGATINYQYPDTIFKKAYNTNTLFNFSQEIGDLAPGSYVFKVRDTCGLEDTLHVTIALSQVRQDSLSTWSRSNCVNNGKIAIHTYSNMGSNHSGRLVQVNGPNSYSSSFSPNMTNTNDTLNGLYPGIYYINYFVGGGSTGGSPFTPFHNAPCDVLRDTITLNPYTQPMYALPSNALCGNIPISIALIPDSSKGVKPYTFQILSGPVTTGIQTSPIFNNLPVGTYQIRMYDSCGNSFTDYFSVDTPIIPAVATIGNTCIGGTASFILPNNSYYTYQWTLPNNSVITNDTLTVANFQNSDYGNYVIRQISSIAGCLDTTYVTYHLAPCSPLPTQIAKFEAYGRNGSSQINWSLSNEDGLKVLQLEWSNDGKLWNTIYNTNTGIKKYQYTHTKPSKGINLYRLKMVENDNGVLYGPTKSVNFTNNWQPNVYPNPVNDVLNIDNLTTDNYQIQLVDVSGKLLQNVASNGQSKVTINSKLLANGIYFVNWTSTTASGTIKVIINH